MVRWTQRAQADLRAIHDYISKDSAINAGSVMREIIERANGIDQAPRCGRKVPELDDANIREIPVYSWRVIYQLRDDTIFVITLVHKRRAPASGQLRE